MVPEVARGRSGFELHQPLFLTLGESQDLTFTPGWATGGKAPEGGGIAPGVKGPRLGLEWRGAPYAGPLQRASARLLYDVLPERVRELTALGGREAPSPAEVARAAGPVFTVLPSLASVEKVITGPAGVLEGAGPATVIIQMSTISPTLTRRLGEAAASAGIGFLDAPMSGTSSMVERGDCTIFAGGDAALI